MVNPAHNRVACYGFDSLDEAFADLDSHHGWIACDTETVNTTDLRAIGIGIAWGFKKALYFAAFQDDLDSQHFESPYIWKVIQVLNDSRPKIFFNAPFDMEVLEPFCDVDHMNWQDVSIPCRVQALHNSLEQNAGEILGRIHQTIRDILPKGKTMLDVDLHKVAVKCINDCLVTWTLWYAMDGPRWVEGEETGFIWYDVINRSYDVTPEMIRAYRTDRELVPLLRRMGKKGMKLDIGKLQELYKQLAAEKYHYLDICKQQFGFDPGSNQQTGYVLASRGNYLPWTKKGQWKQFAVGEDELLTLTDPLVYIILEYRKRADKLSDVIEPLLGKPPGEAGKKIPYTDWRAFERFTTHFRLDLATSRLASSRRNIQNITPELRSIFVPEKDGVYTWWDANQIEYRIFGYLSQEPNILNAYREGQNVHEQTMQYVWPGQVRYFCCQGSKCKGGHTPLENPLYTAAKTGNYSVIYFVEAKTLTKTMRRDEQFCQDFINSWRQFNPIGFAWMLEAAEEGFQKGWVPTIEGRRCRLPDAAEQGEEHVKKCAINYRIQGSAAWPIKLALLEWDEAGLDQRVQLHDEVVNDGDVFDEIPPDYRLHIGELEIPVEKKKGPVWS